MKAMLGLWLHKAGLPWRVLPMAVLAMGFLAGFLRAGDVWAQEAQQIAPHVKVTCPGMGWSQTRPPINQEHVFCGQVRRDGKVTGFHARPGGQNPKTVEAVRVVGRPDASGVYGAVVTLRGRDDGKSMQKFSTLFPDQCTPGQIIQSILNAEANRETCPAGAPGWAVCGYNRPTAGAAKTEKSRYCLGDDDRGDHSGQRFFIAMGLISKGRINTAFPLQKGR